jgi:hypothetical protein
MIKVRHVQDYLSNILKQYKNMLVHQNLSSKVTHVGGIML